MTSAAILELLAAALVVLGVLVITIGVFGMLRMPDLYSRLHAASKGAIFGVAAVAASAALVGTPGQLARAILIAVFLLLTAPLSAHAIGRARLRETEGERERERDE